MSEDVPNIVAPTQEVFNAAGKVAENIITYFQIANWAMENNQLQLWWINLDKVYMEADFSFKKADRDRMMALWKKINPNQKTSYGLLKEYHIELRRLCTRFFTMGEGRDPRTSVYR